MSVGVFLVDVPPLPIYLYFHLPSTTSPLSRMAQVWSVPEGATAVRPVKADKCGRGLLDVPP